MQIATFVAIFVIGVGAFAIVITMLLRSGRREYHDEASKLSGLKSLPLPDAKKRAQELLRDLAIFRVIESVVVDDRLDSLGASLREFLMDHERVEFAKSGIRIGWAEVRPSTIDPGNIRIGGGFEGTKTEFDLTTSPGTETVREFYHNEAPDPDFGSYPSVYHWLIAAAADEAALRSPMEHHESVKAFQAECIERCRAAVPELSNADAFLERPESEPTASYFVAETSIAGHVLQVFIYTDGAEFNIDDDRVDCRFERPDYKSSGDLISDFVGTLERHVRELR